MDKLQEQEYAIEGYLLPLDHLKGIIELGEAKEYDLLEIKEILNQIQDRVINTLDYGDSLVLKRIIHIQGQINILLDRRYGMTNKLTK